MTNKIIYSDENLTVCEYPRLGDYDAISFSKGEELILVLGVSGTAQVAADCGLKGLDIQRWLLETGSVFVNEISEMKKLMITSNDVLNGKLNTDWSKLKEMEESYL
ncbi:hypothetical protein [Bacillus wiedmannii]|uniref:Uncharacterized protein n=1 Tax=Bacillus wiedmannii TaxID=1890302 RepID=A0A2C4PUK3_9BACI|nr:hypothetical protein [Bacillus wiedmannii]KPU59553.1 hypothetical protein AN402_5484 [Bacillus wiedmannii]PHD55883.1 hypothetical protein COF57_29280 [Bacillus wiedmannii]PRT26591.1 hypothetical protein C6358_29685 [Bacillus wiedmannii]PRT37967.1 hypothetical protein C6359_29715 [Bacillus wiedmannii]